MLVILDGWDQIIFLVLMMAVALKALIGFHWPWEKCECCGKKFREHKREIGPPLPRSECRPFKEGYLPPPEGPRPKAPSLPPSTKKKNRMEGCV
jgi:hypothetical protein